MRDAKLEAKAALEALSVAADQKGLSLGLCCGYLSAQPPIHPIPLELHMTYRPRDPESRYAKQPRNDAKRRRHQHHVLGRDVVLQLDYMRRFWLPTPWLAWCLPVVRACGEVASEGLQGVAGKVEVCD
jgi:hypothetical protein